MLQPLSLADAEKRDTRTQFAALPFRVAKKKGGTGIEVLLVSSRDSGRWVLPKGWPMDGLTPSQAAAREAWEEAGVRGRVHDLCLGLYFYSKWIAKGVSLPVMVALYPLEVRRIEDRFPEAKERKRKWLSRKKAAARVAEPDLQHMIRGFSLDRLR